MAWLKVLAPNLAKVKRNSGLMLGEQGKSHTHKHTIILSISINSVRQRPNTLSTPLPRAWMTIRKTSDSIILFFSTRSALASQELIAE